MIGFSLEASFFIIILLIFLLSSTKASLAKCHTNKNQLSKEYFWGKEGLREVGGKGD